MKALLDLLFEGHSIRVVSNGQALWVARDLTAALGISDHRRAMQRLDDDEKGGGARLPSLGGPQSMQTVTQSGLYHLILLSSKPVAKRFRKWVTGEVLPQIAKYGSYLPGATPAERIAAFWGRWKQERAELLQSEEEKLAATGLLTIAAFRVVHAIPARDGLAFARAVQFRASLASVKPQKFYQRSGMRCAWPESVLVSALVNIQPRLALEWRS